MKYIVDDETGEILGLQEEFHVTDEKSVDWVLEKMAEAEADILREQSLLETVTRNIESRKKEAERRRAFLAVRFGSELEDFARQSLTCEKSKTIKRPFGRLAFRTVKGGLRASDPEIALETAKALGWNNAIKVTESFQISKLTDDQKTYAELQAGFVVLPDREVFDVKIGVSE